MAPSVRVLLFATARTAAGAARLDRNVPANGLAVADFLTELTRDYPALRRVVPISRLVRNGEYLPGPRGRLRPGDELAIHPPYSGG